MINNDVKEDYCSFEISRLLQNKGFVSKSAQVFSNYYNGKTWKKYSSNYIKILDEEIGIDQKFILIRPTHSLAIKWIRENFGFYIYVDEYNRPHIINSNNESMTYTGQLYRINKKRKLFTWETTYDAIEAALLYTLKKFI